MEFNLRGYTCVDFIMNRYEYQHYNNPNWDVEEVSNYTIHEIQKVKKTIENWEVINK